MATTTGDIVVGRIYANPSSWMTAGSAFTIDATNDEVAAIFMAPKTGSITTVRVRLNTVTIGSGPNVNMIVTIEGVATGTPDGSDSGGGSPTAKTTALAAGNSNTFVDVTLTNALSVTAGSWYAVVINSDDADGTDYFSMQSGWNMQSEGVPYICTNAGGAGWSKVSAVPTVDIIYSDGSYVPGVSAQYLGSDISINENSTPDEIGNLFTVPVTCSLVGAVIFMRALDANRDYAVKFYGSSTVAIQMYGDYTQTNSQHKQYVIPCPAMTLLPATSYRITLLPQNATNAVSISPHIFSAAAARIAGMGGDLQRTQRTDAGAWSETATEVVSVWPILSDLVAGSTGGGLKLAGYGGLAG